MFHLPRVLPGSPAASGPRPAGRGWNPGPHGLGTVSGPACQGGSLLLQGQPSWFLAPHPAPFPSLLCEGIDCPLREEGREESCPGKGGQRHCGSLPWPRNRIQQHGLKPQEQGLPAPEARGLKSGCQGRFLCDLRAESPSPLPAPVVAVSLVSASVVSGVLPKCLCPDRPLLQRTSVILDWSLPQ